MLYRKSPTHNHWGSDQEAEDALCLAEFLSQFGTAIEKRRARGCFGGPMTDGWVYASEHLGEDYTRPESTNILPIIDAEIADVQRLYVDGAQPVGSRSCASAYVSRLNVLRARIVQAVVRRCSRPFSDYPSMEVYYHADGKISARLARTPYAGCYATTTLTPWRPDE